MLNEGKWVGLARFWNPGICVSSEFGFVTENTIWMALFCQFLATLARDFPENKNVNLMFDEKRGMRDTVNNYFYKARVRVNKHLPEYFSRSPVGFAASERTIPLQAADLLAYEWRRRISEKEKQPDKNVRTSYAILRKHRKAFLHHINRDNWNDLELRSAKDASKFIDLLMNCEGTEE